MSNGLFTVELDFGASVFKGDSRWLGIEVKTNGTATYTLLSPRQPINTTPYAISSSWSGLSGVADGTDADTKYTAGAGLTLTGTTFALNTSGLSNSKVVKYNSTSGNLVNSQIHDNGSAVGIGNTSPVGRFRVDIRASPLDFAGLLQKHRYGER